MGVSLKVSEPAKRGDLLFLNPYDVVVKEELRGRSQPPTLEQITQRALSMITVGQLQPVEVRKGRDGKPVLTLGFTRVAAARLIREGFEANGESYQDAEFKIQCKVVTVNDEESFIRNIIENVERNATSAVDDALNQEKLRERYGKSDTEVARIYGYKNNSSVSRLKKILLLSEQERELVHTGTLSVAGAIELLDMKDEDREKAVKELLKGTKVTAEKLRAQARDSILADDTKGGDETEEPEGKGKPSEEPAKPTAKPRSVREVKKFWEGYKDFQDVSKEAKTFAKKVLQFMEGTISEEAFIKAVDKIFPPPE